MKAGQVINIKDTARDIDDQFLIQKVRVKSKQNEKWIYDVQASSTMFGIIEFMQLLLKRSEKLLIDVSEIVDIVQNIDETITIKENYSFTHTPVVYYAGDLQRQYWQFVYESGSTTSDGVLGHD